MGKTYLKGIKNCIGIAHAIIKKYIQILVFHGFLFYLKYSKILKSYFQNLILFAFICELGSSG